MPTDYVFFGGNKLFELGIKIFLSYLLGSVSGSLLMGRLKGTDIRKHGSGNAGATNALRTMGLGIAIVVAIIDVGKGMLAAGWISGLDWFGRTTQLSDNWTLVCCGAAAVVGHIYPFWHQFRGGKGAATLIGAYCMIAPKILIPTLIVFIVIVTVTGYVGLSTSISVVIALLFALLFYPEQTPILVFALVMALLVVYSHRSNIKRMLDGNEHRLDRARIWRK